MKIAIDVSPLSSGHKVRGVGFYLRYLKNALTTYFPENEYVWFEKSTEIPYDTDVVHYPYFDPFFLTLPVKKKFPTVVTVHDLTPLVLKKDFPAGLKGLLKWRVQRLLLRSIDAVITDSLSSQHDVVELVHISKKKVHVAYLAAGEEFKNLTMKDKGLKIKEKYHLPEKFALYVGDVTPNKNVPRIMQAAMVTNISLVMVGKALAQENFDSTNPWNKDLVKVKKVLKESKNIFVLGFLSDTDLVEIYNAATIFIMPSLYEGFGLPVVEAMSCGCPVLSSHAGSLKEVVGDSAYIVDPNNEDDIVKGLKKMFESSALQDDFRTKGFEQAKKFSWKKTAEDTIHVYEKVLGRK